ncbi:unnamed protein product [Ceutorhynchus assimilis]|uniref:Uncharacterized protein n=1 Tax=Ceutorhynchus assimilis TaxID=467358 RepID=A0A9N9MIN3_9CUCU|nr:unnamed protein product [Ceutorhynchus assimilis]
MSKRQIQTLDKFVIKKKRLQESGASPPLQLVNSSEPAESTPTEDTILPSRSISTTTSRTHEEITAVDLPQNSSDIGEYVNYEHISDSTKYYLIKNAFVPGKSFQFPYSVHKKNDKEIRCFLSTKHFDAHKWLTFSKKLNGLFCIFCSLFMKLGGVNTSTPLNKLVRVPPSKYSKLFGKDGDLMAHESNRYHQEAMQHMESFITTIENPEKNIINLLDSKRTGQIKQNRERLRPIIETIIFLGRQNIPLRGHRDYGKIDLSIEASRSSDSNEGNFRELLKFRAISWDNTLKDHLNSTNSKATYTG